jgi:hypothetical protein
MDANTDIVFIQKIKQIRNNKSYNLINKVKYDTLINEVKSAKVSKSKSSLDYRRLKRFDIITLGNTEKLITPLDDSNEFLYFIPIEEMYGVLDTTHKAIGHGGRDKMFKELSKKYKNITLDVITSFISLCKTCQLKKPKARKKITVQPILSKELNSRGQVDLIDMQSQSDGDYKFIMVYQDHLTKFCFLKALKSKRSEEVAYNLIDIFAIIGAPTILHSDNGREFCNQVIEELASLWDDIKLVHGRPRHSQSQGSVERANRDIEEMLSGWLKDNETTKWSEGLRFVQFMKNRSYHSGIRRSPYEAVFGQPVKLGLKTSKIPEDILPNLRTEEDLESALKSSDNTNVENTEDREIEVSFNQGSPRYLAPGGAKSENFKNSGGG